MAVFPNNERPTLGKKDVTIVVTTGRMNGVLKLKGGPLSYQSYSSTNFQLNRSILCEGPRSSKVMNTLFSLPTTCKSLLELDMPEDEANAFPRLMDYMYHGVPMNSDDVALLNLAKRLAVQQSSPEGDDKMDSNDCKQVDDEQELLQPQNTTVKKRPHVVDLASSPESMGTFLQGPTTSITAEIGLVENTAVNMLESFGNIPSFMHGIQSSCAETKQQAQQSLARVLNIPKGQEADVAPIITRPGGCVLYLLQILSSDQYAQFHLPTVQLLRLVAQASEFHASRLEKAFVVEKMIECQSVHGLKIRSAALQVLSAIAKYSETLSRLVLNKRDCLQVVLDACKHKETKSASIFLLFELTKFLPLYLLRKDVVKATEMMSSHDCDELYVQSVSIFLHLANSAVSDDSDILRDGFSDMVYLCVRGNRKCWTLGKLTQLAHKRFAPRHVFKSYWSKELAETLVSPDKSAQTAVCGLIAALAKTLCEHYREHEFAEWCASALAPRLVRLIGYEGPSQAPAIFAITELIQYSSRVAKVVVDANGVSALCSVLRGSMDGYDEEQALQMNVALAFQSMFGMGLITGDMGVITLISTSFSRAMSEQD